MATNRQLEELIASLDDAVNTGLAYFEGPGAESDIKIDAWSPREILAHMVFWHQATVEGIEAVGASGQPYQIGPTTDEVNDEQVEALADKSIGEIVGEIHSLQARLVSGVRALEDPSATVFIRSSGAESSGLQRLEMMANHWNGHIEELQSQA